MSLVNSQKYALEERRCSVCGKRFQAPRTSPPGRTCSAECGVRHREARRLEKQAAEIKEPLQVDGEITALLKKKTGAPWSLESICDALDRSPKTVKDAISRLQNSGYNLKVHEDNISLDPVDQPSVITSAMSHDLSDYSQKWWKFGLCGDKHLCNMHARLDVLKLLYDLYEAEGIDTVYDTGNWIDGEARFNRSELLVHGMDAQIDYWIDNHPQRKGITTYFVAGDDHEGWYQQRECIEIGRYAQMRAEKAGRNDLVYLGYAEARVVLKAKHGERVMMVNHPGGGSSYAVSYKGQKHVESLQGGEKPAIILQGHYHKFNYGYPREVHVVDSSTVCDQTLFMRKRNLQAHVGGQIIEAMQAPDGRITRFRCEFLPFYDRGFYEHNSRKFGLPKQRAKVPA